MKKQIAGIVHSQVASTQSANFWDFCNLMKHFSVQKKGKAGGGGVGTLLQMRGCLGTPLPASHHFSNPGGRVQATKRGERLGPGIFFLSPEPSSRFGGHQLTQGEGTWGWGYRDPKMGVQKRKSNTTHLRFRRDVKGSFPILGGGLPTLKKRLLRVLLEQPAAKTQKFVTPITSE